MATTQRIRLNVLSSLSALKQITINCFNAFHARVTDDNAQTGVHDARARSDLLSRTSHCFTEGVGRRRRPYHHILIFAFLRRLWRGAPAGVTDARKHCRPSAMKYGTLDDFR